MINHKTTPEEKAFLKNYDMTAFDRPSLTADMAVFAVLSSGKQPEYRKDPGKYLGILLIRRGGFPYKDHYALPGGFSHKDETIEETALRELKEETSLDSAYLEPFGMFSRPGRDPRGWIISQGFLALVDAEKYRVRAGSDAWEAGWFKIDMDCEESTRHIRKDNAEITTLYRLKLEKDDVRLTALVKENRIFSGHHEKTEFQILEDEGLAFDHAEIIVRALKALREKTAQSGRIVFDLMPELFTLYSLQEATEIILGEKLLTPNFRRKMSPFVTETTRISTGAGHRPAKLFRRNMEAFYG